MVTFSEEHEHVFLRIMCYVTPSMRDGDHRGQHCVRDSQDECEILAKRFPDWMLQSL